MGLGSMDFGDNFKVYPNIPSVSLYPYVIWHLKLWSGICLTYKIRETVNGN